MRRREELVRPRDDDLVRVGQKLAEEVKVDRWEVRIEHQCLRVLALYDPVASDLRRVIATLRVNRELEGLADGIILNPGAWTHYSYAIRDALEIAALPAVEVHLSNVDAREPWRRHSVITELCVARIAGKGADGYRDALQYLRKEFAG